MLNWLHKLIVEQLSSPEACVVNWVNHGDLFRVKECSMSECSDCGQDHGDEFITGNGEMVMSFAEVSYAFFTVMAMAEKALDDMLTRAIEAHEIAAVKAMQRVISVEMMTAAVPIMNEITKTIEQMYPEGI